MMVYLDTSALAMWYLNKAGNALRTLDAIHLSIARSIGAEAIATYDRIMLSAAESLKMKAIRFDAI